MDFLYGRVAKPGVSPKLRFSIEALETRPSRILTWGALQSCCDEDGRRTLEMVLGFILRRDGGDWGKPLLREERRAPLLDALVRPEWLAGLGGCEVGPRCAARVAPGWYRGETVRT